MIYIVPTNLLVCETDHQHSRNESNKSAFHLRTLQFHYVERIQNIHVARPSGNTSQIFLPEMTSEEFKCLTSKANTLRTVVAES